MPITVVLAVGLETSSLETRLSDWQFGGFSVTSARSIRDAIRYFKDGDFDIVLLGPSILFDSKERLAFLIRASGSRAPIVSIADSPCNCDEFVDTTLSDERNDILDKIKEIAATRAKTTSARLVARRI
jgi:hypothetical protein